MFLFVKLTIVNLGFPYGSDGKESTCNAVELGSIPGFGRSPGEGKGYPLQYSGLENSMDTGLKESDMTEQISLSFWRRERLPTPVFWLREFHGLYSPWGHKLSDTTG